MSRETFALRITRNQAVGKPYAGERITNQDKRWQHASSQQSKRKKKCSWIDGRTIRSNDWYRRTDIYRQDKLYARLLISRNKIVIFFLIYTVTWKRRCKRYSYDGERKLKNKKAKHYSGMAKKRYRALMRPHSPHSSVHVGETVKCSSWPLVIFSTTPPGPITANNRLPPLPGVRGGGRK